MPFAPWQERRPGNTIISATQTGGGLGDFVLSVMNLGRGELDAVLPILSSIPILGGLFGRQGRRTSETELFLFLTPRVLHDDADVDQATRTLQPPSSRIAPPR